MRVQELCETVEVAVQGFPSLTVPTVPLDVMQHLNKKKCMCMPIDQICALKIL